MKGDGFTHPSRKWEAIVAIGLSIFMVTFDMTIVALAGLFPVAMRLPIFWTMIVMYCIAAIIAVSLLTTLAIER